MNDKLRTLQRIAPVLIPFFILLSTQFRGVDFGHHWDEHKYFMSMQRMLASGILLPGFYVYPSVPHWLCMLGTISEAKAAYERAKPEIPTLKNSDFNQGLQAEQEIGALLMQQAQGHIGNLAHQLRVRKIFIFVSALTVLWVYLTVLVCGYKPAEALLAACLQAFSWEVAYHSRFIAPDAIMMQFTFLTVLFCVLAVRREGDKLSLRGAAVAAALATGSKYTAGLVLLPVLASAYLGWNRETRVRGLLLRFIEVFVLFGGAFIICTPAIILEPILFWKDLLEVAPAGYQFGWVGHTVPAGWPHVMAMGQWLALVLLSKYKLLALVLFALAGYGAVAYWRESRTLTLVLFIYPVIHFIYMSTQWAMIVRNLIVLCPFVALLAARGVIHLHGRITHPIGRKALVAGTALMLVMNALWLMQAANTIKQRGTAHFVQEMANYIDAHSGDTFFLSPGAQQALAQLDGRQRQNVTSHLSAADYAILFHRETCEEFVWTPATDPFLTVKWFGPMAVNMNYYPSWAGDHAILVMTPSKLTSIPGQVEKLKALIEQRKADAAG